MIIFEAGNAAAVTRAVVLAFELKLDRHTVINIA